VESLNVQHSIEASLVCQFLLGLRDLNGRPNPVNATKSIAFTTLPVPSQFVTSTIIDASGQVTDIAALSDPIDAASEPSRHNHEIQLIDPTVETQGTYDGGSDIAKRGSAYEEA